MAQHTYRKRFEHEIEAIETARGFHAVGPFDGTKAVDVSVGADREGHWVYVTLEGELPPDEVALATGYERLS